MRITGVILAGGESRRMGTDKALLEIAGVPVISHSAAILARVTERVLIACGKEEREAYRFLDLPQIMDRYPGLGPLAGLHAAFEASHTEWIAALACDLPFVTDELLLYMIKLAAGGHDLQAVVPVSAEGRVQPLLGLYHLSVLPDLEAALKQQNLRVMEWLSKLKVHYVHEGEDPAVRLAAQEALLNMNTPEDYTAAVKRAAVLPGDSSAH